MTKKYFIHHYVKIIIYLLQFYVLCLWNRCFNAILRTIYGDWFIYGIISEYLKKVIIYEKNLSRERWYKIILHFFYIDDSAIGEYWINIIFHKLSSSFITNSNFTWKQTIFIRKFFLVHAFSTSVSWKVRVLISYCTYYYY